MDTYTCKTYTGETCAGEIHLPDGEKSGFYLSDIQKGFFAQK